MRQMVEATRANGSTPRTAKRMHTHLVPQLTVVEMRQRLYDDEKAHHSMAPHLRVSGVAPFCSL